MPVVDPKLQTFSQRVGLEPLPPQLRPGEISQEIRAGLWALVRSVLQQNYISRDSGFRSDFKHILLKYFVRRDHEMADEFPFDFYDMEGWIKPKFSSGSCATVLNFVDFLIQEMKDREFTEQVALCLTEGRSAYRVLNGEFIGRMSSDEEAATIDAALKVSSEAQFKGAHQHLKEAVKAVTTGEFAQCVVDSIHAVESVARNIAPPGARDLDAALGELQKKIGIHGALKSAFTKLYGYASDEEGIRHALVFQGAAEVDEADALFMLGASAAFVSYLAAKSKQAMFS
jgi:hypothetical protein